jgi:hypothetical protein
VSGQKHRNFLILSFCLVGRFAAPFWVFEKIYLLDLRKSFVGEHRHELGQLGHTYQYIWSSCDSALVVKSDRTGGLVPMRGIF